MKEMIGARTEGQEGRKSGERRGLRLEKRFT